MNLSDAMPTLGKILTLMDSVRKDPKDYSDESFTAQELMVLKDMDVIKAEATALIERCESYKGALQEVNKFIEDGNLIWYRNHHEADQETFDVIIFAFEDKLTRLLADIPDHTISGMAKT
jgi:hypothetical protein